MSQSAPRLVLYGVGQYGQYIVRMAEEKGWKIVAAFNRAGEKVGKDIGQLAGLGKDLGVVVQDCDTANYEGLDADIGIVMTTDRIAQNLLAYERLMNAGLNVLCHGGEAIYPKANEPILAEKIDAIAKANNVTFTGTGIWDMSRVWAAKLVTGPCTSIKSLFHRSLTNTENFSKHLLLGTGTGMTVDEFQTKVAAAGREYSNMYLVFPNFVMSALGYTVTSCTESMEPVVLDRDFYCKKLEREIPAGRCAGMRSAITVTTAEGVNATVHSEARVLFRDGEVEHMMWKVEGTPSASITITREDSSYMTAASAFNRIRDVIAAPPGIQLITQLGPMQHSALV
jgi:4-hydroxy-tetrahydrodipicolinate reductase